MTDIDTTKATLNQAKARFTNIDGIKEIVNSNGKAIDYFHLNNILKFVNEHDTFESDKVIEYKTRLDLIKFRVSGYQKISGKGMSKEFTNYCLSQLALETLDLLPMSEEYLIHTLMLSWFTRLKLWYERKDIQAEIDSNRRIQANFIASLN